MNSRYIYSFLLMIFLLSACNKKESTVYHGKIYNELAQPVNLKFYYTLEDYNNSTNAFYEVRMQPHASIEIPKEWPGGANYYLDWYTDDYGISNWDVEMYKFNVPNITPDMDPALKITFMISSVRRVCLGTQGTQSTWKAYTITQSPGWDNLSENDRYRIVTLKKDKTGTYQYKDNNGQITTVPITYSASGSTVEDGPVYIYMQLYGLSTGNYMLMTPNNGVGTYMRDTLMNQSYLPPTSAPYTYYFSRQ